MLTILTILLTISSALSPEEISCGIVANFTHWDLTPMSATNNNNTYYSSGNLTWNMCQYIEGLGNDTKTFAYLKMNETRYPLTSGILPASSAHLDSSENIDGITYTYGSDTKCLFNGNDTFGFQNTVICNKNVSGAGLVISVRD